MTDHEADLVRCNPGLFDKATEDEAWAIYHTRLRAAAGHAPSRPIQRPAGPLVRLVVDNDVDPDLQHTLDETRASWGDMLVLAFAWVVMLLPVIALLAGCTATGKAPECRACLGAYDVSLSSHREALE